MFRLFVTHWFVALFSLLFSAISFCFRPEPCTRFVHTFVRLLVVLFSIFSPNRYSNMPAAYSKLNAATRSQNVVLNALDRYGYLDVSDIRLLFQPEFGAATSHILTPPEALTPAAATNAARLRDAIRLRSIRAVEPLLEQRLVARAPAFGGRFVYVLTKAGAAHCRRLIMPDARPTGKISSIRSSHYTHRRMANLWLLEAARNGLEGYNEWSINNNRLPGVTTAKLDELFVKRPDGLVVSPPDKRFGGARLIDWVESEYRTNKAKTFYNLADNVSHYLGEPLLLGTTLYMICSFIILTQHKTEQEARYWNYARQAFELLKIQRGMDRTNLLYFVSQHFHDGHYLGCDRLSYADILPNPDSTS